MRASLLARLLGSSRTPPFVGVRGKLVLWNIAVLGAILLLVGAGVYVSQSLALEAQVNGQLASQAQRELAGGLPLEALLEKPATSATIAGSGSGTDTDADAYRADASPNLFTLVIDLKGNVVSGSTGVQALGLPDQSAARLVLAGKASSTLATVDMNHSDGGGHFRLYTVPVSTGGHIVGALQVGTSLTPRYAELREFLLLLTLGGVAGLVLAAAGGYFLAHRALVPVRVAFERQRAFVADASHELRTPLSLIRAEAELLLRSLEVQPDAHDASPKGGPVAVTAASGSDTRTLVATNAQTVDGGTHEATEATMAPSDGPLSQREMARDLLAETDYMNRLITALLQLARIDRGQETLTQEMVDLDALTARTCQFAQPLAAERSLVLTYQRDPGARPPERARAIHTRVSDVNTEEPSPPSQNENACQVWGDADRLRQLLLILVDNALRYTPSPGAVTLSCGSEMDGGGSPTRVVLRISDTGPGIAPEHVPHLFDRFYRADKARSRELGGSGLGLAIGAWIAQAHSGTLSVASTPGVGATFELVLPAAAHGAPR